MADFDNGLPPAGTDVTDSSVNAVDYSTGEAETGIENRIAGATYSKEDAGQNWATFL